jgi:hypothetical protein
MTLTSEQLRDLAGHYNEADTTDDLERAERDDSVVSEPMVTTSLRLPRSTMDELRREAEERGVRPTQLMRAWIDSGLARRQSGEPVVPVSQILKLVRDAGADVNVQATAEKAPRKTTGGKKSPEAAAGEQASRH